MTQTDDTTSQNSSQDPSQIPSQVPSPGQPNALLAAAPRVVNIGLDMFAANLASQGTRVVHVQWSPPAGGDSRLAGLLDKLRG